MPDPLTTVIVGLCSAIIGVGASYASEWFKWRREQKDANRDRQLALKRELYIPLISALTEGADLLVRIPNAPSDALASMRLSPEAQNALAAKDLIASDEVLFSVGAAARELALAITRLMILKAKHASLETDIGIITGRINQLIDEDEKIVIHLESLNAQSRVDAQYFKTYGERLDRNRKELDQKTTQQSELFDKRDIMLKTLHEESIKEVIGFSPFLVHAIIAMRKHLELPDNSSAILAHQRAALEEVGKLVPGYLDEVWESAAPKQSRG